MLDELEKEVAQGHKIKGRIAELEDEKRVIVEEVEKWKELAHEWKVKEDALHAEEALVEHQRALRLAVHPGNDLRRAVNQLGRR